MARIYLDARNITEHPAGVARYAQSLIPELVRQAPGHDFVTIRHSSNREPIDVLGYELEEVFVDTKIDNMDNFLRGARTLKRAFGEHGEPNIYHNLFHISPLGLRVSQDESLRIVVTLHDLVWIEHPHESQSNWFQAEAIRAFAKVAIPHTLRTADHVISVSEPTAERARPWLPPDKVTTIYHGVDAKFFEQTDPPAGVLPELVERATPYVVAIGNAKDYKNLGRLIAALGLARKRVPELQLVLIGNCDGLRPKIDAAGLAGAVHLTGFLDESELRRVLGHARLFVFPSLVEGFGLPVLEGMAMGVPTVVSDLEPMRTVAGDGGMLVDPRDTEAMADAIVAVATDDELNDELRERGRERAAEFRWPLTARKTLQVYKKLL
jgi:glycosyltransferase involved in cell wall biosynthesis